MVSCLGDKDGNAKGNGFLLLDSDFNVKGRWKKPGHSPLFGYDFWYQPRHKTISAHHGEHPLLFVMESTFSMSLMASTADISMSITGRVGFSMILKKVTGFVGCALSSKMVRIFKTDDGSWSHEPLEVQNWILPEMPGLITDFLISPIMGWGLLPKSSPIFAEDQDGKAWQAEVPKVKGNTLRGGPQMIQLSLDGKRLYVTNSLFSNWDKQFYPELIQKGSHMLQIDVDNEKGGLSLSVDFGAEPDGPSLAHEMRYPGGDCTWDIWV
ncbi:hypothetical protein MLD38_018794 [Melastoma candidum]|uniref:Uncharacterized protein n=1 Tax=Melastoma candidum TaxID=119954 RepID=A0ACB9QUV5_9MYRT|nr:hypothetical protein MLD38_018794 [Melastoma candidum]